MEPLPEPLILAGLAEIDQISDGELDTNVFFSFAIFLGFLLEKYGYFFDGIPDGHKTSLGMFLYLSSLRFYSHIFLGASESGIVFWEEEC